MSRCPCALRAKDIPKHRIVTGASSGLGEAAALGFAQAGAKVVVAARREDKGQTVVDKIDALGAEGLFIKTDVTKRSDFYSNPDIGMLILGVRRNVRYRPRYSRET